MWHRLKNVHTKNALFASCSFENRMVSQWTFHIALLARHESHIDVDRAEPLPNLHTNQRTWTHDSLFPLNFCAAEIISHLPECRAMVKSKASILSTFIKTTDVWSGVPPLHVPFSGSYWGWVSTYISLRLCGGLEHSGHPRWMAQIPLWKDNV